MEKPIYIQNDKYSDNIQTYPGDGWVVPSAFYKIEKTNVFGTLQSQNVSTVQIKFDFYNVSLHIT